MTCNSKVNISFLLPAFNEEEKILSTLNNLINTIQKDYFTYEIIVIDDGSTDKTRELARKYMSKSNHVEVIGFDANRGKGHALIFGFFKSRGDIVVFLDSDNNISPSQINKYISALDNGDVAIASKYHPLSVIKVPLFRKYLSFVFNVFVRLATGLMLSDTQTGLKAVRREALYSIFKTLTVRRFAFDVELLVLVQLCGLKVSQLPVKMSITKFYFNPLEVWNMFVDILGIAYRVRISKWYQKQLLI